MSNTIIRVDFHAQGLLTYRYVELNRFPRFRKYAPDLPQILHNRPRVFVKHCLDRIEKSKDVERYFFLILHTQ
jgi:hypothetical protein